MRPDLATLDSHPYGTRCHLGFRAAYQRGFGIQRVLKKQRAIDGSHLSLIVFLAVRFRISNFQIRPVGGVTFIVSWPLDRQPLACYLSLDDDSGFSGAISILALVLPQSQLILWVRL
jgi:hypothetical protein